MDSWNEAKKRIITISKTTASSVEMRLALGIFAENLISVLEPIFQQAIERAEKYKRGYCVHRTRLVNGECEQFQELKQRAEKAEAMLKLVLEEMITCEKCFAHQQDDNDNFCTLPTANIHGRLCHEHIMKELARRVKDDK